MAAWLGKQLKFPVISKDRIKEVLFNELGWRDREWSKALGRASVELMYSLADIQLESGNSVILENAFYPELASPKLQTLERHHEVRILQIICDADSEVLLQRFKSRAESGVRHDGHVDIETLDELATSLGQERPLRLELEGRVLRLDTTDFAALSYEAVLDRLVVMMNGPA